MALDTREASTAENVTSKAEVVGGASVEGTGDVSSLGKLFANELKSIGIPAENSGIRSVTGNSSDAFKFFKKQVIPSTIREVKSGVYVGNDGEGITFTYRSASKSGPPTIDVNGVQGLRKIKFIN
ncbi:hypothetical protein BM613_07310 [Sulfoacidibacillus thermotolerans]|uniref:Uncharacterized protein n=2 Tax=Sulfoacidibacillus thermotolerans TaxID=1765684 RepID=A0A2U3D927_SULT2|nr:hypothetical protein BM613_07310 [Sulfoacidibacillus thermotolerans]